MKKTTVYEDKAEKERKRREKEEEYRKKHTVPCPHCGKDVLDHMTSCPSCKKEIKPKGYTPMSDKKIMTIKIITFAVGIVVAIVVLYFLVWKK